MHPFNPTETAEAVIRWIREYFEKSGGSGPAVVGLSGGKDSTVVAALCARALGPQKVFAVLLPRGRQHDIEVAREVAAMLGIPSLTVNIAESTDALLSALQTAGMEPSPRALVNTPARIRMTALYAVAATLDGRVANTCNLSEDTVGYSTKHGDAAGDFSPLSRLTATEVKAVGRALGLPPAFTEKTPEDGLTGLSDEENLGFTYEVLDEYIRRGTCADAATREKIGRMRAAGLHKLAPMPRWEPPAPEKPD